MGKSENIGQWISERFGSPGLADPLNIPAHPCYQAYFKCFNAGLYYEAHDVLEHLWLQKPRDQLDFIFFKSLIQFAGGYVHLRLHKLYPQHRIHGRRLYPAAKLFELAASGFEAVPAVYHRLPVCLVRSRGLRLVAELELSAYQRNPWRMHQRPTMRLLGG